MENPRWTRIQALFHEAVAKPSAERLAFLQFQCQDDPSLVEEVLSMLTEDDTGDSLLDRGLPEIAYEMVGTDLPPSQAFGPYRLQRILGEGGMGVVWLAERVDVGNLVAIKFLPHASLSPARRERFLQETRTLARLTHPYIARLYDAGALADGTPWFVMEYVDGIPLNRYLDEHPAPIDGQLHLFRKICEAVQYAHGQTIVHRDLKPSNILVQTDGTPKLLDFGIARELQEGQQEGDQTRPGPRFMSPHYSAPEWIRAGVVGLTTDVYSLGVMLYQMLAGSLPERSAAQESAPVPPTKPSVVAATHNIALKLSRAAWSDLDAMCLKAMREDRTQRYPTVEALLRDIDHFLAGEPLEARPDSASYKLSKFLKRNRNAVLAVSLAILLIVCLTVAFTIRLARARDAALAEAARTKRVQRFMHNMLGGAEQMAAPSSDLRVITLLDRGVQEADSLAPDPESQGQLYEELGSMYDLLGEFPKADKLLQLAEEREKQVYGSDDARVAEIWIEIGVVQGDEGRLKEAERSVRHGLEIEKRLVPQSDPRLMEAQAELGRVLGQAGSYKDAVAVLEPIVNQAVPGKSLSADQEYALSMALLALGFAKISLGDRPAAESLMLRSLELDRRLFGESHPQVGTDLSNLATTRFGQGRYAEAESLYREASGIFKNWYGPDHPDTATIMGSLARTLMLEGKDSDAEPILKQVLEAQEKAYGQTDFRVAFTLDSIGRIAEKQGNFREAEFNFNRAVAIDRAQLGEENYQTAILSADLGDAYAREANYARAEPILQNAVSVLGRTLPPDSPPSVGARIKWGRALLGQKRYADAEKQLAPAYKTLAAKPHPNAAELDSLSRDLVTIYTALHQPEEAKKYRDQLPAASAPAARPSAK